MAEAIVLVCDICGKPEATTVTFRVGARNLQEDFCARHLSELVQGARAPKRGRRPGSAAKAKTPIQRKPARRRAVTTKTAAARKATRKRTAKS